MAHKRTGRMTVDGEASENPVVRWSGRQLVAVVSSDLVDRSSPTRFSIFPKDVQTDLACPGRLHESTDGLSFFVSD